MKGNSFSIRDFLSFGRKKFFLYLLFGGILLFPSGEVRAQGPTRIDSLKRLLRSSKEDTARVNALNALSGAYQKKGELGQAREKAKRARELAEKKEFPSGLAKAYRHLGLVEYYQGNYKKTLGFWKKTLKIEKRLEDRSGMAAMHNNLGILQKALGNYEKAIGHHRSSLELKKKLGDKEGMASSYNKLGTIFYYQGHYDRAIRNYHNALKIREKLGDKKGIANVHHNIGAIHRDQNNYKKAKRDWKKALRYYRKVGDKGSMAEVFNNLGVINKEEKHYWRAQKQYQKALDINKELNDQRSLSTLYTNLGELYFQLLKKDSLRKELFDRTSLDSKEEVLDTIVRFQKRALRIKRAIGELEEQGHSLMTLGKVARERNKRKKALTFFQKAAKVADSVGARPLLFKAEKSLANILDSLGEPEKALEHYREYARIKDSVRSNKAAKQVARMEEKYKAEKQKRKNAILREENEKQEAILWTVGAAMLILLILLSILYDRFRLIRRQRNTIEEQKEKVDQAYQELENTHQELQNTHQILQEKNREITDSIDYAQRIQEALLSSEELPADRIPEHFILFRPQSQVSGDFYWIREKEGFVYFAAIDCTGHGVPGAFMSMLGVSFLNEIIASDEPLSPGKILTRLRERVIGELSGAKDGMDAALVKIPIPNTKSQISSGEFEVEFAGAQNPLYVIRKGIAEDPPPIDGGEPKAFKKSSDGIEIKGDPMPVGYDEHASGDFSTVSLHLQKEDMLYIFSDGYADQFGGPNGKKFRYGPFKELLARIHDKPVEAQKQELERVFQEWKKESEQEQIDDVLVIGMRM